MRRPKTDSLSPAAKKEQRRLKNRLRREARKAGGAPEEIKTVVREVTPHQENQLWAHAKARTVAMKVLEGNRHRPYWLSIPHESHTPPVSGFYPCSMFKGGGRWYYGFLFREHRDYLFKKWAYARKELTNVGAAF